jgi:hypothetical protein
MKVMIIVDAQLVDAYAHGFAHFVLFDSSLVAKWVLFKFILFYPMAPTKVS